MHRRIHKLWGAGLIEDWNADKSSAALNNLALVTVLEIVLNGDGTVSKVAVQKRSGYVVHDAAAVDVVYSAAPYAALPADVRSANGKAYVRWPFHRDTRECASTYASFFVLRGK